MSLTRPRPAQPTATNNKHPAHDTACPRNQLCRQLLGRPGPVEQRVAVRDRVELTSDGGFDAGVRVAEAGDGGAAAGVEDGLAGVEGEGDAGGGGDEGWGVVDVAVEDSGGRACGC